MFFPSLLTNSNHRLYKFNQHSTATTATMIGAFAGKTAALSWISSSGTRSEIQHKTSLFANNNNGNYKNIEHDDSSNNFDGGNAREASFLPLSISDRNRLKDLQSRRRTIPIMTLDTILPKQKLVFQSSDPRFRKLIKYVVNDGAQEIGIIGFNPHTGKPLDIGVTISVTEENILQGKEILYNDEDNNSQTTELNDVNDDLSPSIKLTIEGEQCFELQGDPYLDPWSSSFYMADVEIVDNREEKLTTEQQQKVEEYAAAIPQLVGQWVSSVVDRAQKTTTETSSGMIWPRISSDVGPMPLKHHEQRNTIKDLALWVAALVNPSSPINALQPKVCFEIRPAMLLCRNDHDRMVLACAALQSSINILRKQR